MCPPTDSLQYNCDSLSSTAWSVESHTWPDTNPNFSWDCEPAPILNLQSRPVPSLAVAVDVLLHLLQLPQVDFVENYKESLERLKSIASETVQSLDSREEETLHITGELSLIIYSVCVFEPVSLCYQLQPSYLPWQCKNHQLNASDSRHRR